MSGEQNKILVHACCGVCFAYPLIQLRELGFEPVVYYFNSNIYPKDEFERRFLELQKYCAKNSVELLIEEYNHSEFLNVARGFEYEPEKGKRCIECFKYRLFATAKKARELDIKTITTTLTVSPHKISKNVFEAGNLAAKEFGVNFLEIDFKKKEGFKKTSKLAYDFGMYRQSYCGCEFSKNKRG